MRNINHPKKGASIKVQPIFTYNGINAIHAHLRSHPRNACLFRMGINTAYRANELLSLTIGQVAHLRAGEALDLKQSKNKEYRPTVLNDVTVSAVQRWLGVHPQKDNRSAPLFLSERKRGCAIGVPALNRLVKAWCKKAGLHGNFGSHTLRKTWGFHQRIINDAPLPLLMRAFGHSTEKQTLTYLCIQPDEITDLYMRLQI